jgi:hypothetical protein
MNPASDRLDKEGLGQAAAQRAKLKFKWSRTEIEPAIVRADVGKEMKIANLDMANPARPFGANDCR